MSATGGWSIGPLRLVLSDCSQVDDEALDQIVVEEEVLGEHLASTRVEVG